MRGCFALGPSERGLAEPCPEVQWTPCILTQTQPEQDGPTAPSGHPSRQAQVSGLGRKASFPSLVWEICFFFGIRLCFALLWHFFSMAEAGADVKTRRSLAATLRCVSVQSSFGRTWDSLDRVQVLGNHTYSIRLVIHSEGVVGAENTGTRVGIYNAYWPNSGKLVIIIKMMTVASKMEIVG